MRGNLRKDPLPTEEDLAEIGKRHEELIEKDYLYKLQANTFGYGKRDVQKLLRFVDRKNGTKRFSRLYLGRLSKFHIGNMHIMDTDTVMCKLRIQIRSHSLFIREMEYAYTSTYRKPTSNLHTRRCWKSAHNLSNVQWLVGWLARIR
jgi:hypothetical protein